MRLNDPQIELVHDDPFMGYIETTSTSSSAVCADTETAPAPPAVATVTSDDDEDVDVGEDSRPPPQPSRRTSVRNNNSRDGTDQSIVIVLLVE